MGRRGGKGAVIKVDTMIMRKCTHIARMEILRRLLTVRRVFPDSNHTTTDPKLPWQGFHVRRIVGLIRILLGHHFKG